LIAATPFADNSSVFKDATPEPGIMHAIHQQYATLSAVFILHAPGFPLISLSPRDDVRVLAQLLLAYAVRLLINQDLFPHTKVFFLIVAPFVGLPGFLWSWWRRRGFTDKVLAARFGEVSADLLEARRVHEGLFPPALGTGPVRVHNSYELWRRINERKCSGLKACRESWLG